MDTLSSPRRIIAVGGGKGGVGKSLVAANLAITLAEQSGSVALVDADLGMANQHTLFGVDHPELTLHDFLNHSVEDLGEALTPTGIDHLSLIAGGNAHPGEANINFQQKSRLLRQIRRLPVRTVVVDVGAGMSYNVIDLFNLADIHLVVMTHQLVSIQNAYAFLKAAVHRVMQHSAADASQRAMFEAAHEGRETERLTFIAQRLAAMDAGFGSAVKAALQGFCARFIGNYAMSENESAEYNALNALVRLASDFLGIESRILGCLRASRRVHDSVSQRIPFLVRHTNDPNARALREMAGAILEIDVAGLRQRRDAEDPALEAPTGIPNASAPELSFVKDLDRYMRRHARVPTNLAGTLEARGVQKPCRVVDLSASGALVEVAMELAVGEEISLVIDDPPPAQHVVARVRNVRTQGSQYGIELDAEPQLPA